MRLGDGRAFRWRGARVCRRTVDVAEWPILLQKQAPTRRPRRRLMYILLAILRNKVTPRATQWSENRVIPAARVFLARTASLPLGTPFCLLP